MDDSAAILCQISSLKDMLDQVNEGIEANIQITREIESQIVKCTEIESALVERESELMRTAYMLQFEIIGFKTAYAHSTTSQKLLMEELRCLRMKQNEISERMKDRREGFMMSCLEFQKLIDNEKDDEMQTLLKERDFLEDEIHTLEKKNNALENSTMAFMEEILDDLQKSIFGLQVEMRSGNMENEKLLEDIEELKATLLANLSAGNFNLH